MPSGPTVTASVCVRLITRGLRGRAGWHLWPRPPTVDRQPAIGSQLRMILEAYHPTPHPAVLVHRPSDHAVVRYRLPSPANATRVKTTRMAGFLTHHHCTGRVPAQTLTDKCVRVCSPER